MVGMELEHIFKVEGSIDVAILFIGTSQISFFSGVFVMPIGDSTCPITHVVVTPISCLIHIHLYIDKCVCAFNNKKSGRMQI